MDQKAYEEQIEAIRSATEEIIKSKESARQYLKDAGIVLKDKKYKRQKLVNKKIISE